MIIMGTLGFSVTGWAAWSPSRPTLRHWVEWAGGGGRRLEDVADGPAATPTPSLLRRRVSPIGQRALRAAFDLAEVGASRYVVSSRHGEFGRTLSLLSALAAAEPLSPADFSLSVHHALVGLLSIATRNHSGHTAVAAGRESFAYGLLEASVAAAADPDQPVTLIHFDEPLPPPYDQTDGPQEDPLALALCLRGGAGGRPGDLTLGVEPAGVGDSACESLALDFLSFLLSEGPIRRATGERMRWTWGRTDGKA